jgi:hypothetical protein
MGIPLSVLVDRLERSVPPRDGAPGDYELLCQEAVQQLSLDLPIVTTTTLLIVAGTANYALPADFLYVIEFPAPAGYGDVMITNRGLVPLPSGGWSERWYVEGANLRLEPVPTYGAARQLKYAAGYALDGSGSYARLSENGARVALLYARHLALSEQANVAAPDGWSYKIGDESVDKRGVGAGLQAQAKAAMDAYNVALRPLKGYGSQYRANQFAAVEV